MNKAIEVETKYGKDGRPLERRWSVGAALVMGVVALVLGLTGHTPISEILVYLKGLKWGQ